MWHGITVYFQICFTVLLKSLAVQKEQPITRAANRIQLTSAETEIRTTRAAEHKPHSTLDNIIKRRNIEIIRLVTYKKTKCMSVAQSP